MVFTAGNHSNYNVNSYLRISEFMSFGNLIVFHHRHYTMYSVFPRLTFVRQCNSDL